MPMDNMLVEGKVCHDGVYQPIIIHSNPINNIGQCTPIHMHDYIEMLYCKSGSFEIWLNGKYFRFDAGDLVIINSGETHKIFSLQKSGGQFICARFLPEILYTSTMSAFDFRYVMPFILNNSKHQRVFGKSEIENTFIPSLMNEALSEYENKEYGYELAVKTAISRIFLWIVRYWHKLNIDLSNDIALSDEMLGRMQKVLDYVSVNYSDDIKAYEIADMCNLSYSYFSRVFKQHMKKSFSEYLNYIRITNAERLLTSTDFSITDIAAQCGFATSSYFIQQFKHLKGMSPKQFKKSLKNK